MPHAPAVDILRGKYRHVELIENRTNVGCGNAAYCFQHRCLAQIIVPKRHVVSLFDLPDDDGDKHLADYEIQKCATGSY